MWRHSRAWAAKRLKRWWGKESSRGATFATHMDIFFWWISSRLVQVYKAKPWEAWRHFVSGCHFPGFLERVAETDSQVCFLALSPILHGSKLLLHIVSTFWLGTDTWLLGLFLPHDDRWWRGLWCSHVVGAKSANHLPDSYCLASAHRNFLSSQRWLFYLLCTTFEPKWYHNELA